MQYKVPQKIDLEDKLIGPLTLKQFIYLLAGGMIDYLLYSTVSGFFGWLLIFVVTLLAVAFAFVKVQEQPFSYLVLALFNYFGRPKLRLWDKEAEVERVVEIKNKPKDPEKDMPKPRKPEEVKSALAVLAQVVDTHGWSPAEYKEELENLGFKGKEFDRRIKSTSEVKQELNISKKPHEEEVDLLHKVEK